MGHFLPSSGGGAAEWVSAYALDFSAEANKTITSGANTIDGITWTAVNHGATSAFEIVNGSGLEITNSLGSASWGSSAENGPALTCPISTLATYDRSYDVRVRYDLTFLKAGGGGEFSAAMCGMRETGGSATTFLFMGPSSDAGVDKYYTRVNADGAFSANVYTEAYAPSSAMVALVNGGSTIEFYSGAAYAAGWPSMSAMESRGSGTWARENNNVHMPPIPNLTSVMLGISSNGTSGQKITIKRIEVYTKTRAVMP